MIEPVPPSVEIPPADRPLSLGRARDPKVAAWLSLIPGLGQLANRQPGKAVVFFGGVLLLFFLSFSLPGVTTEFLAWWRPRGSFQVSLSVILELVSLLLFIGVFLAALLFWYAAVHDARRTALDARSSTASTGRWWLFRK